jgi:hypothetical protein
LLLLPAVMALAGLIAGSSWLTRPTPGWHAMPLGNFILWSGQISLALAILWWSPAGWVRRLAMLGLLLALAWGAVGRWLSGNWSFSFTGSGELGSLWLNGSIVFSLLLIVGFKSVLGLHLLRSLRG